MEELLMCSVCIERYHEKERHPVLLPRCGHSFCRPCVATLVSAGCIICPTCRTDQRIDFVDRLPTEYTLLAIISAQENCKKETCEIHSVKLSFWCRTCQIATCGECLFEDHPTHSHEVIRAAKYIDDMKQNAQEVAVKFLEALDEREQTFYKIIFHCTMSISFALRNIGVLRKDMEEARELMKGIKDDESSITSATSLSEAAKFLGLKWNIQDANFNRSMKEEKEKDEIQIEKERAQVEDARKQKELKEEEEKKALKEKKKERKLLRKSKTLSAMEMMKQVESIKEKVSSNDSEKTPENERKDEKLDGKEKSSTEVIEKNEKQKQNENKLESKNDVIKQEENNEKDVKTEKDAKNEEKVEKNIKIDTNVKSEEKADKDATVDTNKIEEEPIKEETEVKSKIEEPKVKEIIKHEEITINDIIKRKEQLKKPDPIIHNDKIDKNDKFPDFTLIKPRARVPRIKPVIKKPTPPASPAEEKTQTEALEPAAEKNGENTKEETIPKKEKIDIKEISKKEPSQELSKENKDAVVVNGLVNGFSKDEESESSDEEEEEQEHEKIETTEIAVQTEADLTEESKDTKKKDSIDFKVEGKLIDFIQVPGFMMCVEAADGRLASMEWGPQGLHVHCLQFTHVTYDIVVRETLFKALIPSKCPIVFLELTSDHTILGRVYIKLWGHLRRAHNFISLCLGEEGKSYMNTKFLQVYNVKGPGERILGGDYEYNNGRGGKEILDDLEWNADYAMPMEAGMITAAGSGQAATNSLFIICSQGDVTRNFSCPFGIIYEGLNLVKEAVHENATKQIWITDCGVLIVPPNMEQQFD